MEFTQVLSERSSVRDFRATEVPAALINEILNEALKSPSWSNTQPYRVAVATGERRDQLARDLKSRYDEVSALQGQPTWKQAIMSWVRGALPDGDYKPILKYPEELQRRRVETAKGLYRQLGIGREDRKARDAQTGKNFEFFGAPVVMFIFVHEGLGVYSALDAGLFLQSLMLAATDRGLGTCAQGALAMWRSPVARAFDIPPKYNLLCGLSLGYPSDHAVNQFQPDKRTLEEILLPGRD